MSKHILSIGCVCCASERGGDVEEHTQWSEVHEDARHFAKAVSPADRLQKHFPKAVLAGMLSCLTSLHGFCASKPGSQITQQALWCLSYAPGLPLTLFCVCHLNKASCLLGTEVGISILVWRNSSKWHKNTGNFTGNQELKEDEREESVASSIFPLLQTEWWPPHCF